MSRADSVVPTALGLMGADTRGSVAQHQRDSTPDYLRVVPNGTHSVRITENRALNRAFPRISPISRNHNSTSPAIAFVDT
jgi:hypothetical protein